jgi:hypothetical protein
MGYKFTDEDVKKIREEYINRKQSMRSPNVIELAQRYGVSQETIRNIANGITYRWVS